VLWLFLWLTFKYFKQSFKFVVEYIILSKVKLSLWLNKRILYDNHTYAVQTQPALIFVKDEVVFNKTIIPILHNHLFGRHKVKCSALNNTVDLSYKTAKHKNCFGYTCTLLYTFARIRFKILRFLLCIVPLNFGDWGWSLYEMFYRQHREHNDSRRSWGTILRTLWRHQRGRSEGDCFAFVTVTVNMQIIKHYWQRLY